MKKAAILVVSAATLATICAMSGYWFGKRHERRVTNGMIEGSFVNNLSALQSLRAGDTTTASRKLEAHVFMSATVLLNDPNATHQALDILRPDLLAYRRAYRTEPSDWTPMEQKLEKLLSSTK